MSPLSPSKFNCQSHFSFRVVQPTTEAYTAQRNMSLRAALTEIEELKQSQRCVEISLAKQIEENENLTARLAKQVKETEVSVDSDLLTNYSRRIFKRRRASKRRS